LHLRSRSINKEPHNTAPAPCDLRPPLSPGNTFSLAFLSTGRRVHNHTQHLLTLVLGANAAPPSSSSTQGRLTRARILVVPLLACMSVHQAIHSSRLDDSPSIQRRQADTVSRPQCSPALARFTIASLDHRPEVPRDQLQTLHV